MDVTAEQLKCLEMVLKDFNEWFSSLPTASATDQSEETHQSKVSEKDQHYKDDLRAGAFQFVDCSTNNMDEMPLPYQVSGYTPLYIFGSVLGVQSKLLL